MNELKDFSKLRPADEPLDEATSARVWENFTGERAGSLRASGPSEPGTRSIDHDLQVVTLVDRVEPKRPRRLAILGAAAALVAGIAGLAVIIDNQPPPAAPAAEPAESPAQTLVEPSTAAPVIADPPLLGIDDPAWSLVGFRDVVDPAPDGNRASTVLVPEDGISAGWISIVQSPFTPGGNATPPPPTTIAGDFASRGISLDQPVTSQSGIQYAVNSSGLDQSEVQRTVEAVVNEGAVPDDYSVLADRDVNQFWRQVDYEFQHADGRQLFVTVLPRAETLASEIMSNADSTTTLDATRTFTRRGNQSSVMDRRGFWTLQISASPTFDASNAIDIVAPLGEIDADTWNSRRPEDAEPMVAPIEVTTDDPASELLFPVLDDVPNGLTVSAIIDETPDEERVWTEALLARNIDGFLTESVVLTVQTEPFEISPLDGKEPTDVEVLGEPATLLDYGTTAGTAEMHVTWGDGPYFLASGSTPLEFLDSLDAGAVTATIPADASEPPQLTFELLPDGFDVVAEPQTIGRAHLSATLSIGADNYDISVGHRNPVIQMSLAGDLRTVEMDGQQAFTFVSQSLTQDIAWQVNDSTYAYLKVNDGSDGETALELANDVTFIEFDSWAQRYEPDSREGSEN